MKLEDYFKYYIQGSDHYLIPKNEFIKLFNEMNNWKEENQELKKRLEEYRKTNEHLLDKKQFLKQENQKLKNQLSSKTLQLETQKKEFIKYLEDFIDKTDYEVNILGNYIYLAWSNAYKEILLKYKKIVGDK